MSRIQRIHRRRASHSVATHERARTLAAERLDEALAPSDAAWLEEHLVGCVGCRSVAAAYEADRVLLRRLRDRQPEPPRDLWARTAAALERESAKQGGPSRRAAHPARSGPALGVLSGLAVVVVVIGATILSGGIGKGPTTAIGPGASLPGVAAVATPTAGPTPIVVGAGTVGWFGTSPDGRLAYNTARVNEVCPADRQPDCAPVVGDDSKRVEIAIRPKSISRSPVENQAVVVGTDSAGNDSVLVIALPTAQPTGEPSATPTTTATPTPTVTPVAEFEPGRHADANGRGQSERHPDREPEHPAESDRVRCRRDRLGCQGRRPVGRVLT